MYAADAPAAARADLFKFWVLSRVSSTERAKARLWENQFIDFGYEVPDHMMAMLLGLVFCIVAPPIAVIAAAYFLVNSIIARYQVCYVYTPRFETGGQARLDARRDGAQGWGCVHGGLVVYVQNGVCLHDWICGSLLSLQPRALHRPSRDACPSRGVRMVIIRALDRMPRSRKSVCLAAHVSGRSWARRLARKRSSTCTGASLTPARRPRADLERGVQPGLLRAAHVPGARARRAPPPPPHAHACLSAQCSAASASWPPLRRSLQRPSSRMRVYIRMRVCSRMRASLAQAPCSITARRGAQVVMFGLLGLKSSGVRSAALQTVALLPLPLLTLAQWLSVGDLFAAPLKVLSLKAAAELDRRDQARARYP